MTNAPGPAPPEVESRTIGKLQRRILPLIFPLYVIAFLDRINIGFAALTMNRELAINSQQFGGLVGAFFLGYFVLEIPSNLILHRIGARIWMARILIVWGIVAAATGLVRNVSDLYLARFLLGLAEAGFFPGMLLYLTYWFRQRELAQTIALFMLAQPITSILGGPLSGLILDRVNWLGLGSWRWLLILEGLPAIIAGVAIVFVLPSRPAEASFLTKDERTWIAGELEREEARKVTRKKHSPFQALASPRVWHLGGIGFTQALGFYTMSFFLPQEMETLSRGHSHTTVGLLVMIPHLVGLLAMVLISRSSDRAQERRLHMAVPLGIAGLAFIALGHAHPPLVAITLLCGVALGVYGFLGPFFASAAQAVSEVSAASGIALITSVANLGGFAGPYAVGFMARKTGSLSGGLALAGASLLGSAGLVMLLRERFPRRQFAGGTPRD